ncbi:MAG: hypothetical protein GF418_10490, partial [Chitinivibrionales bacterium]|nr:hypothetical protein [Chitinivibrionales bacterium]MBD3396041.1 hypothetical protein [Chitinivibrionales bacterium]
MVPPDSGYGSWGTFELALDSVPHPGWRGHHVRLYAPRGVARPPAIFFCHGINASDPRTYLALLTFLASKGFAVVHAPYGSGGAYTDPPDVYAQLWEGIAGAVKAWGGRLDTTRIGFVGHSYGGGAV